MQGYAGQYMTVVVAFAIGGLIFGGAMAANRLLAPQRPTVEKLTTYECGIDPVEGGWAQSYVRYYVFAYLYVVFAVDAVFLFPWATVFAAKGYGAVTLGEMFVFLAFLAVGLLYAWRMKVLSWV
jgi:NADH-quinone oxidoreductase subunit A